MAAQLTFQLPRRGGINYLGPYVGGAPMNIDYKLTSKSTYRSSSQLRSMKALSATEQTLQSNRNDISIPKFHGNLDTDTSASATEMNKSAFEDELRRLIKLIGLQTFFFIPDSSMTEMIFIVDHPHKVTLQAVKDEHTVRMNEPDRVFEVDLAGNITTTETQKSKEDRFACYDMYETNDVQLSRLIVDSLISSTLRLQVMTRFRHDPEFENYPGSIYLMMVYEVVNASTSLDITKAGEQFKELTLSSYPGQNISKFTDEALRLIRIMECGYALPYQLGSELLEKVHQTESTYFNMQVQLLLHQTRTMENSIGPIADPKTLESHAEYSTCGPLALCSRLQTEYSDLLKSNSWPALAPSIPESNNAPAADFVSTTPDDKRSNAASSSNNNNNPPGIMLPPKIWKYLKPADEDQCIVIHDIKYFWCGKCVCRRTNQVGFYNRTHSTSKHQSKSPRHPRRAASGATPNDSVPPIAPSPDVDSANLSAAEESPSSGRAYAVPDPSPSIDNDFQFQGAFMHRHDDGALWMTPVDDDDDDAEFLEEPLPPPSFVAPGDDAAAAVAAAPAFNAAVQLALAQLSLETTTDGFHLDHSFLQASLEEMPFEHPNPEASSAPVPSPHALTVATAPASNAPNPGAPPSSSTPVPSIPTLDASQLSSVEPSIDWINAADAADERNARALFALSSVAHPRNPTWASNVISSIPGVTLYNFEDVPHVVYGDIHEPAHCNFCGRLGDWKLPCRCDRGVHYWTDDDDYSDNWLDIHWSDEDTAEFLATDSDSDEEEGAEDEELEFNINSSNSPTTSYLLTLYGSWWFLQSFFQACFTFSSVPSFILNGFHTLLLQLLTQIWSFLSVFLLFLSALGWDTIYLFLDPSSPTPTISSRKFRRSKSRQNILPFPAFTKSWMLLSYFMLAFSQLTSPVSAATTAVTFTYHRIQSLHEIMEVTPSVHLQYAQYRRDEIRSLLQMEEHFTPLSSQSSTESTLPVLSANTTSCNSEFFFNCHSTQQAIDSEVLHLDFHLCQDTIPIPWIDTTMDTSIPISDRHQHVYCTPFQAETSLTAPPSPTAMVALTPGLVDLYPLSSSLPSTFPVIIDSGASLAISPHQSDFVGTIHYYENEKRLGGMAGGLTITGIGRVAWSFKTTNGILTVHSKCYLVPDAKARLLSPQRLFCAAQGVSGEFSCREDCATLTFDNVGSIDIPYDPSNHLPICIAKNLAGSTAQSNLAVLNESNQNLTGSQKLLLLWHARFGHKGFGAVQRLLRSFPFTSSRFKGASTCDIPRCEVCEYAKSKRQSTKGVIQHPNPLTANSLKLGDLTPGSTISVDHFESRLKGRTLHSFGKSKDSYVGGCIFVDHMSGYIHMEEQMGFSGSETIRAKQSFERFALDHGIIINSYLCDNGIFKSKAFVRHLHEHNQKVHYCGVNAHHKNGIAERNIRTVSECARALLLHAALRWKDGPITSSLWPFAVRHACYLFNHCPDSTGTSPADRFLGTTVPRHQLLNLHCWGSPAYVLDPVLQQGRKLPKWQPRSRRGAFVGFSRVHSSDVPLILNLKTGYISPQYHLVFDDTFSTVLSHGSEEDPPSFWNDLELDNFITHIPVDSPTSLPYPDDGWLTPSELEEKQRLQIRAQQIRQSYPTSSRAAPTSQPSSSDQPSSSSSSHLLNAPLEPAQISASSLPPSIPSTPSSLPPSPSRVPLPSSPSSPSPAPAPSPLKTQSPSVIAPRTSARLRGASPSTSRRGTRVRTHPERFAGESWFAEALVSSVTDPTRTEYESDLAYLADISTDPRTGDVHCIEPRAYAAKHKVHDPDMPSYTVAVTGPHSEEYIAAMKKEINQLIKQKTWSPMFRKNVPPTSTGDRRPILKGTWVFKLKRLPDGTPSKFKARYCVRGDLQKEGIDYFETYAPVVQWSTVRLILTLILAKGWVTKQVDYTNAFAQAVLKEEVYIEAPRGFARSDGKDVLKLNNSLYGLKQAPKTFYEKLRDGLLERGFVQSMIDPCLFMKHDMICVIYVDDTIITGPDAKAIEDLISSLGVAEEEQIHTFELRDEGEVGAFLGIQIERQCNDSFILTQTGLIKKVLTTAGMENSKATVKTPAATTPLGLDLDGQPFDEDWDYPVIIGMLMYLAQNSRPDIAYAVHQCARFTHSPKHSHAVAVKRILRYLNSTKTKGMTLRPNQSLIIDCYVDADFAGLWNVEHDQDPLCVKSRSGFLITFMGCPLHWVSKLQTQIALSTMEAEYIALSQAMRELIGLREMLKEIYTTTFNTPQAIKSLKFQAISKTFGEIPSSTVHEDNEACLRFATVPKMSPRTKHIAIPYHFFREKVANGEIHIVGIGTDSQLADQFTKGLPQDKFLRDRKQLVGW